jgi:hypothetical protein
LRRIGKDHVVSYILIVTEVVVTKKAQHVVPRDGGWAVRSTGASRVSGRFQTQDEAIAVGRERARSQGTELYIHGKDGRIRERNSYGTDPHPTKG